jgi:hypothetical protein
MKRKTRSPRVVERKPVVKPVTLHIASALVPMPTRNFVQDSIRFSPRTEPFTAAELAGLEIPAFLQR